MSMNHGTARAIRYWQKRGKQEFIFSGRAWGGQITRAKSSHGPVTWDLSDRKKPCPGGEEGQGQAGSEAAWDLQVARCVHVFDLRFDMRRESIGRPAGLRLLLLLLLTLSLLCLFPTG